MGKLYCLKADMGYAEQFTDSTALPDGVVAVSGKFAAGDTTEDETVYVIYSRGDGTKRVSIGDWVVTSLSGTRTIFNNRDFLNLFVLAETMIEDIQAAMGDEEA